MDIGYWQHIATLGGIQAILALGFYITFLSGQFSAAHAAFMGVGAYAAGLMSSRLGLPFPLAVLLGALTAALTAALLAGLLRQLSGMILTIATLAFAEILIVVLKNNATLGGSLGLTGVALQTTLWQVLAVLLVLVLAFLRFEDSRLGISFRAVRDETTGAAAMGIDLARTRIMAFALGGFLCGIAGGLQVHYLGVIEPDEIGFYATVALMMFVVVGGRDYFCGPILAAFVFTALPELLRVTSRGRVAIFSFILIMIVILKPAGVIPRPVYWRWRRARK
jgi:branched-chain amino acid transport system permease protein